MIRVGISLYCMIRVRTSVIMDGTTCDYAWKNRPLRVNFRYWYHIVACYSGYATVKSELR